MNFKAGIESHSTMTSSSSSNRRRKGKQQQQQQQQQQTPTISNSLVKFELGLFLFY
jgi:hypothetical protein